jgi:membrane fusion protein (multidrug efflux system)
MNIHHKTVYGAGFVIAVMVAACTSKSAAPPPAIKDYALISIERQKAVLNLDYPASLEGRQTVEIRPRVEGIIEAIYVDEGQAVKKGQPLFRLDQAKYIENIRSFEAMIKTAQAEVNSAQMEVNKVRPLVEKDIVSKFSLQSAEYALQAREAALAQAKASLANAKTDLSYTTITSPANGVIGTIPYKIGALVGSSIPQPLTTVANTAEVYAYFSLNEKQLSDFGGVVKAASIREQIKHAPNVQLLMADGAPYSHPGRIETVSGLIDAATGSARMRAAFPNPEGLLRSGGSGTVRIPVAIDTALLVPQKATYEIQGKHFVYVLSDSNKVRSVEIRVNPVAYRQSFVVQEGLRPGDKVVIEGTASLSDGAAIRPRIVNADSVYASNPKL